MDDSFCVSALESAIRLYGIPDVFNTDQGAQFTGKAFIKVLLDNEIQISMDGKGRWVDNVLIERLWRTVKYEDVYIKDYSTVVALRRGLRDYFQFYNDLINAHHQNSIMESKVLVKRKKVASKRPCLVIQ